MVFCPAIALEMRQEEARLLQKIHTLGPSAGFMAELMASQAMINEISWIKDLTSLGLADWDRSWLSLASRLGCCETWTFEGKLAMIDDDIGISGGDVGRV